MRQIILDTETTGLSAAHGHRLIEIGCLEMINRRMTKNYFHYYLNPQRKIDAGATKVHGLTESFLADKPVFSDIAENLFHFLQGSELIIHNAPFDLSFLDAEFARIQKKYVPIIKHCNVIDTLIMARREHPGQQNTLDALCRRYRIDNKHRDLHGALKDAELLAQVYLHMTGGQTQLFSSTSVEVEEEKITQVTENSVTRTRTLKVIRATDHELQAHDHFISQLAR